MRTGRALLAAREHACPDEERESVHRINVAGIDLASIRLAVLCAETGSLSAAARHAHMSLSCASHRLSTLEMLIRARLFMRDHRGLTPTRAGAIFIVHARVVLRMIRMIRVELDELTHGACEQRAACSSAAPGKRS